MAQVVFVLGAGASAEAGAPLAGNFLDVAEDLWLRGQTGEDAAHFERVFKSIAALKSVHAQFNLDTYNLETVFSAFEMGAMTGRLGSITNTDEIAATRNAMVRLIARTLRDTVRLPFRNRQVHPPGAYGDFALLLQRVPSPRAGPPRGTPAVITLNYDLGLDYALRFFGLQHGYGVVDQPISGNWIPLLKLHGSLNWWACHECETVVTWDLADFFQGHEWNTAFADDYPGRTFTLNVADYFHQAKCPKGCTPSLPREPVVVPPTWNKSDNKLIRNVWRHAARELSEARYLVFVGYSFPKTDLYFQYLLALGLASDTRIRRIVVINPEQSAADQLNEMLTPTLRARVDFRRMPFSEGLHVLPDLLEVGKDE